MSDFDKEAERERLREKYEREEAKREVTEKMSELLLQGATMTNAHCSECGDPIFRYDGQEFCATCERPVERGGDGEAGDVDSEGAAEGTDAAHEGASADETEAGADIEVTTPSENARVRFGDSADGEADDGTPPSTAGEEAPSGPPPGQPHTLRGPGEPESGADADGRDRSQGERGSPAQSRGPRATPSGSDLEETRAALQQTLRRLTQQAQSCEDPREAEAYLSAARQAAETLGALRR